MQEQSIFFIPLIEKIERKSQQVTQGAKKTKKKPKKNKTKKSNPYYERTTRLNNAALLEQSYEVHFSV